MRKFVVNVNGQSYDVEVQEVTNGEVSTPVAAAPASAPAAAPKAAPKKGSGTAVKSPMPGMVLKHCLKDGDQVKEGQAVLILEAMKMENEISAPCDGIVSYATATGVSVDTGDTLAYIA